MMDLDSYLALHADALELRSRRSQLLAANLANADTPHFKARDIDFRAVMAEQRAGMEMPTVRLQATQPGHFSDDANALAGAEAGYRIPMQPSLDGNTVEADVELSAFAENAMRYEASLRFLSGRISGLRDAITGGR
jgi:flagellar basal-body rod protein FlgB